MMLAILYIAIDMTNKPNEFISNVLVRYGMVINGKIISNNFINPNEDAFLNRE